ncbi:hypothetical protein [Aureibacter tunicatorum]|uniref:DUF4412 domain-containing protein n=1 Tax=Aureibacter tunicatorum TaxID=866807 RepID=A0AAE4BSU5_9BACT|nr:hypothetical protein [Aureibacter tunicatorum]MDR6238797.1 hypothetical protein [Aureibacter tunicatorum]BDD05275.1 hypothetical protein AUTU_27580 [Aureibacter tunicatorum]
MKKSLTIILVFVYAISFAQNDSIFNRLQAINNNGLTFYNIDGYTITKQTLNYPFTEKNLNKVYRKYSIKKDEKKKKDIQLGFDNYFVINNDEITKNLIQNNSYYFIENQEKRITVIQFSSINKRDKEFERTIAKLIIENAIPKENYASMTIDSINFAGRKIKLGTSCNWTNVNTVQCPYYGEMNWSVHKDLEDAKNTVEQQFKITESRKRGKVISEETVEIEFEGTETTAKRVIYDFTGMTSVLASMSGGKTLTIYYVATEVRGNYVSCVLSFWNNDTITENGLAPLLEKVMKLKNN